MALGIVCIGVNNLGIMEKKLEAAIVCLAYIGNMALGIVS